LWIAYCQRGEEVSLAGIGESSRDMHGIFLGYLMLAGLSIENLIKALAVQIDVSSVFANIRWPGGGHNSLQLLKMASLKLDKDEREILKFLSESVIWLARYPVPKKHESMSYWERKLPGSSASSVVARNDEFVGFNAAFEGLYTKLSRLYARRGFGIDDFAQVDDAVLDFWEQPWTKPDA
jgi:hypothetical protein